MTTVELPSVSIDAARRIVFLRFNGVITLATFTAGREAIQREPGWSRSFAHVFDFRGVTDLDLPPQAIQALASAPPVFDPTVPQILVARSGSFEYALAAMFGVLAATRRNVHVVESMEAVDEILATSGWPPRS